MKVSGHFQAYFFLSVRLYVYLDFDNLRIESRKKFVKVLKDFYFENEKLFNLFTF